MHEVQGDGADDADDAVFSLHRQVGKGPEQRIIRFFNACVVQLHARRIQRDDWDRQFLLSHALQSPVIRADDRRHGRTDDGGEGGVDLPGRVGQFRHQAVVPAQDGVHIAQAGAEYGALAAAEPARLVKAADIAGAAAGVADDDDAV